MKIAITSQGTTLDSQVDPRFGRGGYFIIFDTETGEYEAADNSQNVNAMQGAGIQAAANVSQLGVKVLLTGHCGPNAYQALKASGIQVVTGVSGTVSEVVEQFKEGKLKIADQSDVQGHWT